MFCTNISEQRMLLLPFVYLMNPFYLANIPCLFMLNPNYFNGTVLVAAPHHVVLDDSRQGHHVCYFCGSMFSTKPHLVMDLILRL